MWRHQHWEWRLFGALDELDFSLSGVWARILDNVDIPWWRWRARFGRVDLCPSYFLKAMLEELEWELDMTILYITA